MKPLKFLEAIEIKLFLHIVYYVIHFIILDIVSEVHKLLPLS